MRCLKEEEGVGEGHFLAEAEVGVHLLVVAVDVGVARRRRVPRA